MVQAHSAMGTRDKVKQWHVLLVSKRTWKQMSSEQHRRIRRSHDVTRCSCISHKETLLFYENAQPLLWSGTLCSNFDCSRNPWKFVYGEIVKFEAESREWRRGSWKGAAIKLDGLGERCKLPQRNSEHIPDCSGRSPENASSGRKCCLVPEPRSNCLYTEVGISGPINLVLSTPTPQEPWNCSYRPTVAYVVSSTIGFFSNSWAPCFYLLRFLYYYKLVGLVAVVAENIVYKVVKSIVDLALTLMPPESLCPGNANLHFPWYLF